MRNALNSMNEGNSAFADFLACLNHSSYPVFKKTAKTKTITV